MKVLPRGIGIPRLVAGLCFGTVLALMVRSMFVTDDYALRSQNAVMRLQSHEGFVSFAWTRPVIWPVSEEWKHIALEGNARNAASRFFAETALDAHWHRDALGLDCGLLGLRVKELQQDRSTMEVQVPYWIFAGLTLLLGLRRTRRAPRGPAFELQPLQPLPR